MTIEELADEIMRLGMADRRRLIELLKRHIPEHDNFGRCPRCQVIIDHSGKCRCA